MALIKCPECGETISDKAPACIKCGYPIKELGIPQPPLAEEPVTEQAEEESMAETVSLEGFSLGEDDYTEERKETKQELPQTHVEQEEMEPEPDDLCTVDVPKHKYITWLLVIGVIASLAYNLSTRVFSKYGFYWQNIVSPLFMLLPGIALICNAKGKKTPAKVLSIIFAALTIASAIYRCVVYYGQFYLPSVATVPVSIYLVIYVFQSEKKQESSLWFVLGCIIVPLYTVLSMIFGWGNYSDMVDQTIGRTVTLLGWPFYLVGFSPKRWFQTYQIEKQAKKKIVIGRLAALAAGIIAVVVQISGCIGVSSEEYQDALWSYQLSSYNYSKQNELLKILQPLSDKYYRDNTISIIIACVAAVIFIATLVIAHKRKRVCED